MQKDHPYHDNSMFKGAPAENFRKAECLRNNMTKAEQFLWNRLKNNPWQHPIHLFIVDFYCHQMNLVIEIDGAYHNAEEQKKKDRERNDLLKFQGLFIMRFTNKEVLTETETVLKEIEKTISSLP